MQYYRAPDNSLHAIAVDFANLLPAGSVPISEHCATTIAAAKNYIPAKLRALIVLQELESKVTPRMLREASLGAPPAALVELEQQIQAARQNYMSASTDLPDLSYQRIQVRAPIFVDTRIEPVVPGEYRQETFEEYIQRLDTWLKEHQ